MTRSLAFRRHQSQTKKVKVSRYQSASWFCGDYHTFIGQLATTPKRCSCHMCGNPRKHWKQKSMQELRADAMLDYGT
tara:strand:- start:1693 stop:1923 length:231 start_codon:yes stop_codon:yes gene_type:complete